MSSTGKLMIFAAWIGAAALLTWLFAGELDRRENPNQVVATTTSGGRVEVRLTRNRMGHYVASGRINGRRVELLLDTGATNVALGRSLADELGLKRGTPDYTQTYRTILGSVQLGGITMHNVPASIDPGMSADEVLLGMSFLKHLEIIQRGDRLLLRQPGSSDQ
jgi:aspartyl protease family protein